MKKSLLGIFLMAILSVLSLGNSGILNAQTNLALGQPVTASSVRTYAAANAVDGNASTRWSSSYNEPEWIYVDLGQTYSINQVVLNWETAYGTGYEIQVSDNATSWTTIYSTSTGNGGIDDLTGLSGSGRYVRMYGITRATHWGFSIWEFEVYGATTTPVTGVSVAPTSLTLDEGQTSDLTETVSPSTATDQSVTWSSSNTSVATVDANGLVTAVAEGNATITVTTNDGSFTANCAVTVNAVVVESNLALNKAITVSAFQDDAFGYKPGENLVDGDVSDDARWSASGFPQWAEIDLGANYDLTEIDLYPYQNRAYQYIVEAKADGGSYTTIVNRSSNTTGADVLSDNVSVTARYVKITISGLSGSSSTWVSLAELEVYGTSASTVPVTGVSVAPTTLTLDEGQTSDLTETVSPANATDQSVTWSSSNSSVATVNSNGLVTAVAAGSTTITVTTNDGSFTANCAVTVNAVSGGGLPSPWASSDVGSVAAAGSGDYSSGTFTVQGSGSNIYGTADEFHYVYQQVTGNASIIARIATLTQIDQWTKGGVMMRESLNANSINGNMFLAPIASNGSKFSYRATTGAATSEFDGPNVTAPYWLRMERSGNTFTSAVSTDGSSWTTVGSTTLNMSSTYYVGLVVSSLSDGTLATGTFDNVTVSGTITPPDTQAPSAPTGLTSGTVSSNSVSLSWTGSTDNIGVAGYKIYGGTSVVTVSGTSGVVNSLTPSTSYTFTVKAFDAAGNESAASNSHAVTTTAGGGVSGWPTLATTGPSGTLTPYPSEIVTSSDGQLIENLDINGGIVVNHQNVTIRNCRFNALSIQTYTPTTGLNCVVEDSELKWAGRQNFTLRRCFMTEVSEDLIRVGGPNITIEDCYLWLRGPRADGAHSDIVQSFPEVDAVNLVINHNTMLNEMNATSCIKSDHATITNNFIAGGSYAVYTSRSIVLDNHYSTMYYPSVGSNGILTGTDNTCAGNVIHETNTPLPCPSSGKVVEFAQAIQQDIKVYPNPLNGSVLNIQLTGYDVNEVNVKITDLTGRTVYNQLHTVQSQLELPVNELSNGVYVVSIVGPGINNQQKLVVK